MADEKKQKTMVNENRKARHQYEILERMEAGIVLQGTEVKSARLNQLSLTEAYVVPDDGELFLEGCHINRYEQGNIYNHQPVRRRKLLMKRREIEKLTKRVAEKGLTLIPLAAYFSGRHLKIEIGLARGKKSHDKRHAIKDRESKIRMQRVREES